MISVIARKELIEMFRDGRFVSAAAVIMVLLLAALGAGWKHYADLHAQHAEAQEETWEQWLAQGEKNPHSAAHYGVYAFKPKTQLSMIDTGVDPYTGVAVWLEAHYQNEFLYRPAQDGTTLQRFGELTAASVLQILIPLLIVLLTFSAFAGEREQGTMRQLLSLGVDSRRLAIGKALGVAGALGTILVPAAVVGSLALMLTGQDSVFAADAPRTMLMAGGYLLYFAIFLAISLGVSAWSSSSRAALVTLLAFWALNGLFAARAVTDLGNFLYPTPSSVAFSTELRRDLNDQSAIQARLNRRARELFDEYGVGRIEDLPISFAGIDLQEGENHGNEVFDAHFGRLFDTYERQNRLEQVAGVAAPLLAIRSFSMGLAGTDFSQHRHFTDAAEIYRREIQVIMNDDITANAAQVDGAYIAGPELWAEVPQFEYRAPGASWVLARQSGSVAMLVLWLVGGILFAAHAATRVRAD